MIEQLINFFETAPLDEVTELLQKYDVEFVKEKQVLKYENLLGNRNTFIDKDTTNVEVQSKLSYKALKDLNLSYKIKEYPHGELDNYKLSGGVVA